MLGLDKYKDLVTIPLIASFLKILDLFNSREMGNYLRCLKVYCIFWDNFQRANQEEFCLYFSQKRQYTFCKKKMFLVDLSLSIKWIVQFLSRLFITILRSNYQASINNFYFLKSFSKFFIMKKESQASIF